jgi:hypothetical protein
VRGARCHQFDSTCDREWAWLARFQLSLTGPIGPPDRWFVKISSSPLNATSRFSSRPAACGTGLDCTFAKPDCLVIIA